MTPEQIEKQRAKFQSRFPTPNFIKYCLIMDAYEIIGRHTNNRMEIRNNYNSLYTGWLSAIESNEEIISKSGRVVRAYKNNTSNEPSVSLLGYAVDELQEEIERQGFKVKL